jgi:hypothetical protein
MTSVPKYACRSLRQAPRKITDRLAIGHLDVDTQARVGQNKPLSGGVSSFPSSSACERVGRDRPIHT